MTFSAVQLRSVGWGCRLILAGSLAACKNPTPLGSAVKDAPASSAPRKFLLTVQSKGFIAPIPRRLIGGFDTSLGDIVVGRPALLYAFAAATNLNFSEDPPDGTQATGRYRLWAQMTIQATCSGATVAVKNAKVRTDAGYEGPLKAGFKPLVVHLSSDGAFSYLAQGWPHPAAEPAFMAVHLRTSSVIWYTVKGQVTCTNGEADVSVADADAITTVFPSFRLWTTKVATDGGVGYSQKLVIDRPQTAFTNLWNLPTPPADAPFLGGGSGAGLALADPANVAATGTAVAVEDDSVGADAAGAPPEPLASAAAALDADAARFCQAIAAGSASSQCVTDSVTPPVDDGSDPDAPVLF